VATSSLFLEQIGQTIRDNHRRRPGTLNTPLAGLGNKDPSDSQSSPDTLSLLLSAMPLASDDNSASSSASSSSPVSLSSPTTSSTSSAHKPKPLNPASGIPINVFSSSSVPVRNEYQPFYKPLPSSSSSADMSGGGGSSHGLGTSSSMGSSGSGGGSSSSNDPYRPFKGFSSGQPTRSPHHRPLLSDQQLISMVFTVLSLAPFAVPGR